MHTGPNTPSKSPSWQLGFASDYSDSHQIGDSKRERHLIEDTHMPESARISELEAVSSMCMCVCMYVYIYIYIYI